MTRLTVSVANKITRETISLVWSLRRLAKRDVMTLPTAARLQ